LRERRDRLPIRGGCSSVRKNPPLQASAKWWRFNLSHYYMKYIDQGALKLARKVEKKMSA
ncbi:hypothetical protein, partial [Paenibacillus sp. sgz500992]|uniref:hypothetical protein n=1 Tax=Paenibacillus sp. sgz500992 TaxID=3242476 RepID=UPI0036D27B65